MTTREAIRAAVLKADELPTIVLALAQLLKVEPAKLAGAFYSDDNNTDYRASLVSAMIQAKVQKEKEASKNEK